MKGNISDAPPQLYGFKIRDLVLAMLLLQTTAIVLLMRYSKTRLGPDEPGYRATVAVFFAEVLKLPFCMFMASRAVSSAASTSSQPITLSTLLNDEVFGNLRDTLKCAVPAVAFTIQGNLLFVALANLDAPTYQVTYQSKTVFTALASFAILGRRLKASQWIALLLLCVGGVLVSDLTGAPKKAGGHVNTVVGVGAVLAAAGLSASSSVYFEMMLKKQATSAAVAAASLWLRNIQLGLFATPLAALAMSLNDGDFLAEHGMLHGFDGVVWMVVLLNGLGGLLVAATMKYADNIVKCFAAGLAMLAGTLLSVPIFGFELHPTFLLGLTSTITASVIYARAPDWALSFSAAQPRYEKVPSGEEAEQQRVESHSNGSRA